ncbi:histidine kinase [Reichenbachiella agarivorans]|uniref:Histidine kinase n=1 Tax=Reichenbachiella agarivorans TaxID=2979464 RepID=A0ABY6CRK1_9BACT|nr:sensor histidine kinase [Reichenbachiella agarivorans]UXP33137.1 histidine kinase [Reichenbachiella agarivorans]
MSDFLRVFRWSRVNWWRWLSVVFMGAGIRLFIDIIYSVFYSDLPIFLELNEYLYAIILALFVLEGIRFINRLLDKVRPWEQGAKSRFIIQLSSNTIYAFAIIAFFGAYLYQFINEHHSRPLFDDIVVISTASSLTILVVSIEMGMFFLNKWKVSMIEIERFKKEGLEFRHEMLKTQVNPHFLFNSLNTLSSLVYSDPNTAYSFIRKLSNVYRNVLEHRNKGLVSIKEELESIESYVELIRMRFGEKLIITIDPMKEVEDWQVPPLIFQLLIENAIKHNVVSTKYPLSIWVYHEGDQIVIKNSLRLKSSKGYSSKIGLDNIISHYDIVTDKNVEIKQTEEHFIVLLPLLSPDYEGIDYRG